MDQNGNLICPKPTKEYLPSCWRAGEIIEERCLNNGFSDSECSLRAEEARDNYAVMGVAGHLTVPGVTIEDWLDSGQCRDCYLPSLIMSLQGQLNMGLQSLILMKKVPKDLTLDLLHRVIIIELDQARDTKKLIDLSQLKPMDQVMTMWAKFFTLLKKLKTDQMI